MASLKKKRQFTCQQFSRGDFPLEDLDKIPGFLWLASLLTSWPVAQRTFSAECFSFTAKHWGSADLFPVIPGEDSMRTHCIMGSSFPATLIMT